MTIILELPWPPSVNTYWRSVVINGQVRVLLSRKGREYRKSVADAVLLASAAVKMESRLAVVIDTHAPNKRKSDIDNRLKAPLDAMEHAGVYLDDEQVDDLRIVRCELCRPDGKVIVEIREL